MMRRLTLFSLLMLALIGFAKPALPWGSATHAYIGAHLDEKGIAQADVIYGGLAPDTFNMMFQNPNALTLFTALSHGLTTLETDTVLALLANAGTTRQATFAVGFYSHNNVDAADMTAHGYPYNSPSGYVIGKALVLRELLRPYVLGAGISMNDDTLLDVSHFLIEYGADLLIRRADRSVGSKLIAAAEARSPDFPVLMADTYAPAMAFYLGIGEGDARALILSEEANFQTLMEDYGRLLQLNDAKAFEEMSAFLSGLAGAYLAAMDIEADEASIRLIVEGGLEASMQLCDPDLMEVVEQTIEQTAWAIAPYR